VSFHGCTFIDCRFDRGVFQNVHFQNCTLIETVVGDGDMDTLVHFQNNVFMGALPQSGEFSQNWAMGAEGKLAKGLESLPRPRAQAAQAGAAARPGTSPAAAANAVPQAEILKRQREAEQVLPLEPSSGRFNGLRSSSKNRGKLLELRSIGVFPWPTVSFLIQGAPLRKEKRDERFSLG
jgi:hypothetical protein